MKILIIDDYEEVRTALQRMLEYENHETAECASAEIALKLLEAEKFPLIIVDLAMPGMSGLEFCHRVRADESLRDIYILVITGRSDLYSVKEAMLAGADDYMVKPFDLPTLSLRVIVAAQKLLLHDERNRLEQLSNDSNERFHQMANNITDVFWLREVGRDEIAYVSPAYETIWGREIASLCSNPDDWINSIHPEDRPKVAKSYEGVFNGEPFEQEYRILRPDSTVRWIYDRAFPVLDEDQQCYRFAGIATDITKFKEIVVQLKEAKTAAQQADQTKCRFLANMSHELRTPLNGIIGYGEMLQDQLSANGETKEKKYIDRVVGSGHRLMDLVNDLLELNSLDADTVSCQFSRFKVAHLLEKEIKPHLESLAAAKKLNTVVTVNANTGALFCDKTKIEQILFLLISNAVKFTPEKGEIKIHAELIKNVDRAVHANANMPSRVVDAIQATAASRKIPSAVLISVSDTGAGVGVEEHESIFNRFESGDQSYAREHFGSGIGLAIAKRLVEMHGGQIWVESAGREKGSTFKFLIPGFRNDGYSSNILAKKESDPR